MREWEPPGAPTPNQAPLPPGTGRMPALLRGPCGVLRSRGVRILRRAAKNYSLLYTILLTNLGSARGASSVPALSGNATSHDDNVLPSRSTSSARRSDTPTPRSSCQPDTSASPSQRFDSQLTIYRTPTRHSAPPEPPSPASVPGARRGCCYPWPPTRSRTGCSR